MARLVPSKSTVQETTIATTPHSSRTRTRRHVQKPQRQKTDTAPFVGSIEPSFEGSLLSSANRTDLSDSIGTLLIGIQLSALTSEQLDDLASLVSERGVVFLHDQKISNRDHVRVSEHYGTLSERPSVRRDSGQDVETRPVSRLPDTDDWYADGYAEESPVSFSVLKIDADQDVKGESLWVDRYGLYDALSRPMKRLFDELQTINSSKLTQSPAVQTHPVTGLKAFNVIPDLVTGFADLKKKESDKLLEFVDYHIHSAAEHTIRTKWTPGTVAIWDNRTVAYKTLSASNFRDARFLKTSVLGEKPFYDSNSESREERADRIEQEANDQAERVRLIKARFNQTPLRRIINRQLSGQDPTAIVEPQASESTSLSTLDNESAIVENSPKSTATREPFKKEETEPKLEPQDKPLQKPVDEAAADLINEKISPAKRFNESPLRRIIRRQVSGNNQRQWHPSNLDVPGYAPPLGYKSQAVNAIQAA